MSAKPTELRAVIVAAGKGLRFKGKIPKQFMMLGDVPVALHSVRLFAKLEGMKEIILVLPPGGWPEGCQEAAAYFDAPFEVPVRQIEGGKRRQDSVARGLEACRSNPYQIILVHDSARPFPASYGTLIKLLELESFRNPKCGGGLVAIRATDTIKRVREDYRKPNVVVETVDRSTLWLAQTPQGIIGRHAEAVREILAGPKEFTDESAALESLGLESIVIEGSSENFKITTARDLARARHVLASRTNSV